ncbi:MAG: glycosyltransferase family 4 protein [Pseudomonadota bacterium]
MTYHDPQTLTSLPTGDHLTRVVVINDHSQPNGGAAVLLLSELRKLRRRGIPVTLITGDAGDNPDLADLGVEVIAAGGADLLNRPKLEAATQGMYNAKAREMVADVIASRDAPGTVYHVHNWSQILTPAIFEALRPVAPRVFMHGHDSFLACPNGMFMDYRHKKVCTRVPLSAACLSTNCDKRSYPHKLWRAARHGLLYRCLDRRAPWGGVIAIHPRQADGFRRAGFADHMIHVVRNPAKPYVPGRVPAEDNRVLVYVGRLEKDKGVMDLVRSAKSTGQPLRLIGDGNLRGEIARDHTEVELCGWQSAENIGPLVEDARALVMPSRHPEPFGLVIAEAAKSGLPVVVSDTGALTEDVRAMGLGLAFDIHNAGELDRALVEIRDMSATELEAMSRRCLAAGDRLAHGPQDWATALITLFDRALAREATSAPPARAG